MFVPVKNYEKYFHINEFGDVFSLRSRKILKTRISKSGYVTFATKICKENVFFFVHKLLAQTFISNDDVNKTQVNHVDGVKLNNSLGNLEWVTPSENIIHAYTNGLAKSPNGTKHYRCTITEQDVVNIKLLHVPNKFGKRKISKLLGISVDVVGGILRKDYSSWKHIKIENGLQNKETSV